MATIWDADIMIWAASALVSMKNKGVNDIPDELHFHPFDVLKAIQRQTGGDQYHRLREALNRLKSTVIRTNIRAPRGKKEAVFSWISEWTDLVDERTKCRAFGAEPQLHKRGRPHGSGLGKRRWPVERSNAWLLENKRLALRYDRLGFIIQSLLQAACLFLVAGRLAREL